MVCVGLCSGSSTRGVDQIEGCGAGDATVSSPIDKSLAAPSNNPRRNRNGAAWIHGVNATEVEVRITSLLDSFDYRIVPVDRAVAELWAELLPGSSKRDMDVGIAATARVHGLIVVTRNLQDLVGLGVRLIDPFQSPAAVHDP